MENKLKEICSWINDVAELYKTIEQNKMSTSELKALLEIVDVKRKGYLDLNDVYELAGQITENQLFAIFKFMDIQRTGEIRLEELESTFGNPLSSSKNTTKDYIFPKFYAIIDTVKDRSKIANDYKKKYGFNVSNLKATYEYISSLVQSKYLNFQELMTVLKAQSIKFGIRWGVQHQKIIKEFLSDANVSQAKFVDFLNSVTDQPKLQVQEECLLSGLQTQTVNSLKQKTSQIKVNPITLNKSSFENQSNPIIIYKKNNNFFENKHDQPPSFRAKHKQSFYPQPKDIDVVVNKQFNSMEGNIYQVLNSIQQKREKLRHDSLERKKLIEDVMNRKRELCSSINTGLKSPTSPEASSWKKGQDFYRRIEQSYQKDKSKSYLNKTLQRGSSYSKQQSQYQNGPFYKTGYKSPEPFTRNGPNHLKINLQREVSNSINQRQSRPFTPLNSQSNYLISQILSKYDNHVQKRSGVKEEEQERITLKQLCKSKSGFIYTQSHDDSYPKFGKELDQFYEVNQLKYQRENSDSKASLSKENVLKRAEQEANRKIEEIQRKARMKVLQKKSMARNSNKQEWSKLIRRGCYY